MQAKLVEEEFTSALNANYTLKDLSDEDRFCKRNSAALSAGFDLALNSTYKHVEDVLQKLCLSSNIIGAEESINISSWKLLFVDFVADLSMDKLCEKVFKTIILGVSSRLQVI